MEVKPMIANGLYEHNRTHKTYFVVQTWKIKLFRRWWEFVVYRENQPIVKDATYYIRSAKAFSARFSPREVDQWGA
jgi:hypothetical protein